MLAKDIATNHIIIACNEDYCNYNNHKNVYDL